VTPPVGQPPSFWKRAYWIAGEVVQWLWDNKPYIVGAVAAATAAFQYAGVPVPIWLWFLYVATGQAALHSSVKANTSDPIIVNQIVKGPSK
jgi:hypothetical protein